MPQFLDYSKYYNLLYQSKDYRAEAEYVANLIKTYAAGSRIILDAGCGTGKHAKLLADRGFQVTGADISDEMLAIARNAYKDIDFVKSDIRQLNFTTKFDAIVSLFHVMSYQNTNEDVSSTFESVSKHLAEDGIFIFDCWYGVGVVRDLPTLRVREMEDEDLRIIRITRPEIDFHKCIVKVNFELNAYDKRRNTFEKINESHHMRYFFINELEMFGERAGLTLVNTHGWMSTSPPDDSTWYLTAIFCKSR